MTPRTLEHSQVAPPPTPAHETSAREASIREASEAPQIGVCGSSQEAAETLRANVEYWRKKWPEQAKNLPPIEELAAFQTHVRSAIAAPPSLTLDNCIVAFVLTSEQWLPRAQTDISKRHGGDSKCHGGDSNDDDRGAGFRQALGSLIKNTFEHIIPAYSLFAGLKSDPSGTYAVARENVYLFFRRLLLYHRSDLVPFVLNWHTRIDVSLVETFLNPWGNPVELVRPEIGTFLLRLYTEADARTLPLFLALAALLTVHDELSTRNRDPETEVKPSPETSGDSELLVSSARLLEGVEARLRFLLTTSLENGRALRRWRVLIVRAAKLALLTPRTFDEDWDTKCLGLAKTVYAKPEDGGTDSGEQEAMFVAGEEVVDVFLKMARLRGIRSLHTKSKTLGVSAIPQDAPHQELFQQQGSPQQQETQASQPETPKQGTPQHGEGISTDLCLSRYHSRSRSRSFSVSSQADTLDDWVTEIEAGLGIHFFSREGVVSACEESVGQGHAAYEKTFQALQLTAALSFSDLYRQVTTGATAERAEDLDADSDGGSLDSFAAEPTHPPLQDRVEDILNVWDTKLVDLTVPITGEQAVLDQGVLDQGVVAQEKDIGKEGSATGEALLLKPAYQPIRLSPSQSPSFFSIFPSAASSISKEEELERRERQAAYETFGICRDRLKKTVAVTLLPKPLPDGPTAGEGVSHSFGEETKAHPNGLPRSKNQQLSISTEIMADCLHEGGFRRVLVLRGGWKGLQAALSLLPPSRKRYVCISADDGKSLPFNARTSTEQLDVVGRKLLASAKSSIGFLRNSLANTVVTASGVDSETVLSAATANIATPTATTDIAAPTATTDIPTKTSAFTALTASVSRAKEKFTFLPRSRSQAQTQAQAQPQAQPQTQTQTQTQTHETPFNFEQKDDSRGQALGCRPSGGDSLATSGLIESGRRWYDGWSTKLTTQSDSHSHTFSHTLPHPIEKKQSSFLTLPMIRSQGRKSNVSPTLLPPPLPSLVSPAFPASIPSSLQIDTLSEDSVVLDFKLDLDDDDLLENGPRPYFQDHRKLDTPSFSQATMPAVGSRSAGQEKVAHETRESSKSEISKGPERSTQGPLEAKLPSPPPSPRSPVFDEADTRIGQHKLKATISKIEACQQGKAADLSSPKRDSFDGTRKEASQTPVERIANSGSVYDNRHEKSAGVKHGHASGRNGHETEEEDFHMGGVEMEDVDIDAELSDFERELMAQAVEQADSFVP